MGGNAGFLLSGWKPAKERWIARKFLEVLGINSHEREVRSPVQASKVDVEYLDGRFQIKEITNPDIRRDDEIRDAHRRVMLATTLEETIGPGFAYDVPDCTTAYALVMERAKELADSAKYAGVKGTLDLLFYVTRSRASHIDNCEIDHATILGLGWRSISCLMGDKATVLFAAPHAPEFLRAFAVSS